MSRSPFNDFDDVDRRLAELDYVPDALGRIGRGTWTPKARDDSGTDPEPAAAADAIRQSWTDDTVFDTHGPRLFLTRGTVGPDGDNHPDDVAKVETLLDETGHLDAAATEGPTGTYDDRLQGGIKAYQRDRYLVRDGILEPDGPTLRSLQTELATRPAATPAGKAARAKIEWDTSPPDHELLEVDTNGTDARPWNASDRPSEPPSDTQGSSVRLAENTHLTLGRVPRAAPILGGAANFARQYGAPLTEAITQTDLVQRAMRDFLAYPGRGPETGKPSSPIALFSSRESRANIHQWLAEVVGLTIAHHRGIVYGDGKRDSRGNEETVRDNNIVAKECRKVLERDFPDLADRIEHRYGASKDGEMLKYLAERDLRSPRDPSIFNRADIGWCKAGSVLDCFFLNTVTRGANLEMIGREALALSRMASTLKQIMEDKKDEDPNMSLDSLGKRHDGETDDEFRARAQAICRKGFRKWLGKPNQAETGSGSPPEPAEAPPPPEGRE